MDSDDIKVRLELLGEISESELIFPVGARRAPERSREQLSEHCLSAWRRRRSRELRPLSRIHALRGIRTSCTAQSRLREERREPRAFSAASDRGAFLWVLSCRDKKVPRPRGETRSYCS